jgi:hypothetical protein
MERRPVRLVVPRPDRLLQPPDLPLQQRRRLFQAHRDPKGSSPKMIALQMVVIEGPWSQFRPDAKGPTHHPVCVPIPEA